MAKRSSNGKAREAEANARAAEAAARAAEAQAKADTERARIQAESEQRQRESAERQRKEDAANDPLNRAYQIGLKVGAPVAGMVAGHKIAKHMEARHVRSMQVVGTQVGAIAREARKAITGGAKAALPGLVKAAQALKYAKVTGPLGIPTAALLLLEGGYSRFVLAPEVEKDSKAASDALSAFGTASMFAATGLIGARILQNRSPIIVPNGKDLAAIENAKRMAPKARGLITAADEAADAAKFLKSAGKAGAALKILGKVSLVGTGIYATANAIVGYQDDGWRGAGRGIVDALDPSTLLNLLPGHDANAPGLGERAYNRIFGKSPNDMRDAIRGARAAFGRLNARRAAREQSTPIQLPAPPKARPAPGKSSSGDGKRGWSDAARQASAKARGVAAPGQARR